MTALIAPMLVSTAMRPVTAQAEESAKRVRAAELRDEGYELERSGQVQEAIAKFRASLKLSPDNSLQKYVQVLESDLAAAKTRQGGAQKSGRSPAAAHPAQTARASMTQHVHRRMANLPHSVSHY